MSDPQASQEHAQEHEQLESAEGQPLVDTPVDSVPSVSSRSAASSPSATSRAASAGVPSSRNRKPRSDSASSCCCRR